MSPRNHMSLVILLLTVSIGMEISLLAGIFAVSDTLYHLIHILLMGTLAGSLFSLHRYGKKNGVTQNTALFFAIGVVFTGCGDFINGAVSPVQPVSMKLTWALFLFGAGYALYNFALWQYNNAILKPDGSAFSDSRDSSSKAPPSFSKARLSFSRARYLIAIPILAINVVSWFQHVEANTTGLLYYGSFIFNATIYVMMPTFAVWFYVNSGRSVGGLLVLAGAVLIPYSDLVLFGSWLRGGDPAVPSFQLYAYNWILYFGGQILVSLFPALVVEAGAAHLRDPHVRSIAKKK